MHKYDWSLHFNTVRIVNLCGVELSWELDTENDVHDKWTTSRKVRETVSVMTLDGY